jgi:hypothetical protein
MQSKFNMTYEEMRDLILENNINIKTSPIQYFRYGSDKYRHEWEKEDCLYKSWTLYSDVGGSCWDEGSHVNYREMGDSEPEFEDLMSVLELVKPDVTFLQYKKITMLSKEFEHYTNEYYGNGTMTKMCYITLKDLYEFLCKM